MTPQEEMQLVVDALHEIGHPTTWQSPPAVEQVLRNKEKKARAALPHTEALVTELESKDARIKQLEELVVAGAAASGDIIHEKSERIKQLEKSYAQALAGRVGEYKLLRFSEWERLETVAEAAKAVSDTWASLVEAGPERPWGFRDHDLDATLQERLVEELDALAALREDPR